VGTKGKRRTIGFLGFDGVTTLDLTGPADAFAKARFSQELGKTSPCYEIVVIGIGNRTFASESGVVFKAEKTLEKAPPLDTVVLPGGFGMRNPDATTAVSSWLKQRAENLPRIAAVSTGIYAVAPTGFLNGRQVTTHWRYASALAREFPQVRLNYGAPFSKDGAFYSCGGGTAAIEMTLSMIEEDFGPGVALPVARELVMDLRPPGGEPMSGESVDYQLSPTDRLADLPAWIVAHLRHDVSVEVLAERACLCPRHFSRLFKKLFRTTPADFVEERRLNEARRRLASPRHSIESIAASVGFKSGDAFRRAFERRFGLSPRTFRRQFVGRNAQDINLQPTN
jgi:transcriptional regulator GlxA family with amidase domain